MDLPLDSRLHLVRFRHNRDPSDLHSCPLSALSEPMDAFYAI